MHWGPITPAPALTPCYLILARARGAAGQLIHILGNVALSSRHAVRCVALFTAAQALVELTPRPPLNTCREQRNQAILVVPETARGFSFWCATILYPAQFSIGPHCVDAKAHQMSLIDQLGHRYLACPAGLRLLV